MVGEFSNVGESAPVSGLIEAEKRKANESEKTTLLAAEPEAHYDHYGNRGAADLYIKTKNERNGLTEYDDTIYEVKSEHAVDEANGAADIIRQFKRMRRYFFQDESREKQGIASFLLCFIPTPATLQHVENNENLYQQILSPPGEYPLSSVVFRGPEIKRNTPGSPFITDYDTVAENLAATRADLAQAAGVDIGTIHDVKRDIHE